MRVQEKNKESIFSFLDRQARMRPNETAFVLLIRLHTKNYIAKVAELLFFSIEKQKAILLYRCLNNRSVV